MKVKYKDKEYNLGQPKTLLDMKKKLQSSQKSLEEREILIMFKKDNENKLLEEKQYKDIVQRVKNNENIKLVCYTLKDYLKNVEFQNSQQSQQQFIDLLKTQQYTLKNTTIQYCSQKQIIQNEEQTGSYEQNNQQIRCTLSSNQGSTGNFAQNLYQYPNQFTQLNNNQTQMNPRFQSVIPYEIDNLNNTIEDYNIQRGNYSSIIKTIKPNCINCNQNIKEISFFLSCEHIYHANCLQENLKNQIDMFNSNLYCKCNTKIQHPQKILSSLDLTIYYQKLLNNQINDLKKKIKTIRKCPINGCSFIAIIENNYSSKSFCPICLMNVILE